MYMNHYRPDCTITATYKLMNKTGFIKSDKEDNTITVKHFIKNGFVTGKLCDGRVLLLGNNHMIGRRDLEKFFIRIR